MLFSSCSRIPLFPLLSSPHGPNKVVLDPSCTWIRCTRVSSWYSNGPFNFDLVETFKTNAFNASFNAFVLDWVIGPFGTCNGSLLVFLGWSTSYPILWQVIIFNPTVGPGWIFNSIGHHLVSELGSINQVISFLIFCSCCFRKNSLVSKFFFSLILQHIKKN